MRSLKNRLSLSMLGIILFVTLSMSLTSNLILNQLFSRYVMQQEEEKSETIRKDLKARYETDQGWNEEYLHTLGMYALYDGYILKISDQDGKILWDARHHDMSLCQQIMDDISARMQKVKQTGKFISHTYSITEQNQKVGTLEIVSYGPFFFSENDYAFLKTLNMAFVLLGFLFAIVSILLGRIIANRIANPIRKTANMATQIAQGNYSLILENTHKTTELKELILAVNRLSKTLEEKERLTKQLTADVAHELRTPLTCIETHLEAMADGIWEPTPERLNSCYEEVKRLEILTDDLKNLSEAENETLQMHLEKQDLYELVKQAKSNFEEEAKRKNITLTLEGEVVFLNLDKDRFYQVILNLLSNAMKYTPEGGSILMQVSLKNPYVFSIKDSGIGISKEDLPFIFERFYRTDKSRNRKTGGTGIGLSIAKAIVTAHGGEIAVESTLGVGSSFYIYIHS